MFNRKPGGLRADEVPAILQKGEEVLSPTDKRSVLKSPTISAEDLAIARNLTRGILDSIQNAQGEPWRPLTPWPTLAKIASWSLLAAVLLGSLAIACTQ